MKILDLIGYQLPGWNDTAGTLEAWQESAAALFAPGCEAQSFAVLSSFGAPLMALWRKPTGGAVVSLVGPRRSGRTTALEAAASVWGLPDRMKLESYVGERKFDQLATFGNLPVIADKLPNMAPESARSMIKRFVVGDNGAWATIMLTAAGAPLISEEGYQVLPGVELSIGVPGRLIDPKDKRALAATLISNRGHAGFAFLRDLVTEERVSWARRALVSCFAGLGDAYGTNPAMEMARRTISAAYVAGQIVEDLGLIEFNPERIRDWAADAVMKRDMAR